MCLLFEKKNCGVYVCWARLFILLFTFSISDIVVQILGIGKCEWSEQRRTFQSEEIYLKNEIKIAEAKPSKCESPLIAIV